jgi:translation initiation factor 3 subunit C
MNCELFERQHSINSECATSHISHSINSGNQQKTAEMSRFFYGDSSSESSSDEEELYSEEEEEEKAVSEEDSDDQDEDEEEDEATSEDEDGVKKKGASQFLRGAGSVSEDSSDDDRAKVVKSAKDKRLEELEGTVKAIENGEKINDWGSISTGKLKLCMLRL